MTIDGLSAVLILLAGVGLGAGGIARVFASILRRRR